MFHREFPPVPLYDSGPGRFRPARPRATLAAWTPSRPDSRRRCWSHCLAKDFGKRFEEVNKRFEEVNKRFEEVNKRFDDIKRELADLRERMAELEGSLEGFLAGRRDRDAA